MLLVKLSLLLAAGLLAGAQSPEKDECRYEIVESMPDGVHLENPAGLTTVPTHKALLNMIDGAQKSISIASFYWYLTAPEEFVNHPTAQPGKDLMAALQRASERGVDIKIVLDRSNKRSMSNEADVAALEKIGHVHYLNMKKLLGSGVNHSKYLIADSSTLYIGSSNFDWRSYTQIKEVGLGVYECSRLGNDLAKIFKTYMLMAQHEQLPPSLPSELKTQITLANPMALDDVSIVLGASPPAFDNPKSGDASGRLDDIKGLLEVIGRAKKFIDVSVMNYSPRLEFGWPRKYWPRIEDALRRAAIESGVRVRLLFSQWTGSKPLETVWYNTLNAVQSEHLGGGAIHVKMFKVPSYDDFQQSIPFARVKHDKFMVTDRDLYIGTSNWTPDYFTKSCGVGIVIRPLEVEKKEEEKKEEEEKQEGPAVKHRRRAVKQPEQTARIVKQMQELFERDFNSEFAHELSSINL